MALWDISGPSGLHGTGPCQTDQRPPETLQPEPGKCSHPGSFPTHVLILGDWRGMVMMVMMAMMVMNNVACKGLSERDGLVR